MYKQILKLFNENLIKKLNMFANVHFYIHLMNICFTNINETH